MAKLGMLCALCWRLNCMRMIPSSDIRRNVFDTGKIVISTFLLALFCLLSCFYPLTFLRLTCSNIPIGITQRGEHFSFWMSAKETS